MVNFKFPENVVRDKNLLKEQISYKRDDEKSLLDENQRRSSWLDIFYISGNQE